jgi:uncharacterized protein (DUF305 family)
VFDDVVFAMIEAKGGRMDIKKESLLYGIIGLLLGMVLVGFWGAYAVNTNNRSMMGMMGVNSTRVMSGNIDQRFIEQMIPHHESAIAMAKLAKEKSQHAEIKTLADTIIAAQTAEITTMKQWYLDWYGVAVPAIVADDQWGGHMMSSQASVDDLVVATDFDEAFLSQMISHHQMAVMMANMLDVTTNRPEMKQLADDIITSQTKEISDMEAWQQQWGYRRTSDTMMNMVH